MKALLAGLDAHLGQKGQRFLSGEKVVCFKLFIFFNPDLILHPQYLSHHHNTIFTIITKYFKATVRLIVWRWECLTWCSGRGWRGWAALMSSILAWRCWYKPICWPPITSSSGSWGTCSSEVLDFINVGGTLFNNLVFFFFKIFTNYFSGREREKVWLKVIFLISWTNNIEQVNS